MGHAIAKLGRLATLTTPHQKTCFPWMTDQIPDRQAHANLNEQGGKETRYLVLEGTEEAGPSGECHACKHPRGQVKGVPLHFYPGKHFKSEQSRDGSDSLQE